MMARQHKQQITSLDDDHEDVEADQMGSVVVKMGELMGLLPQKQVQAEP